MATLARVRDVLLLRTISGRDRRAVIIGLAVLLPALLWIVAVRPYRTAMADLNQRVDTERALLEREEALIAAAPDLPILAGQAREHSARATERLVSAANLPLAEAEVTAFLQDVALLSRVLLQEVRSVDAPRGEEESTGTIRPIRLAVRGESDMEGVLTFLQRIESSPLLLRVAELSIEPSVQRGEEARPDGAVLIDLVVHAFVPADFERPTVSQDGSS